MKGGTPTDAGAGADRAAAQVLFGTVRYQKLLGTLMKAFYSHNSGTTSKTDRIMYLLFSYLSLVRLDELGFPSFRKLILSQDPFKMVIFLRYVFDLELLRGHCSGEWSKYYDLPMIEGTIGMLASHLPQVNDLVSSLEEKVFLQKRKEEEEANAWAKDKVDDCTVCIPFNLREPHPRITLLPADPALLAAARKAEREEEKKRNEWQLESMRRNSLPQLSMTYAESRSTGVSDGRAKTAEPSTRPRDDYFTAERFRYMRGLTRRIGETARIGAEERDRVVPPPDPVSPPEIPMVPIQYTLATLNREDMRWKVARAEEAKIAKEFKIQRRDAGPFLSWRATELEEEERQYLEEVQDRKESMREAAKLAGEAAVQSRNVRRQKAIAMKQESKVREQHKTYETFLRREAKKASKEQVLGWREDLHQRLLEQTVRRQSNAKAMRAARVENEALIAKIKAERPSVRRSVPGEARKDLVPTIRQESASTVLLGHMSTEEVKEKLAAKEFMQTSKVDAMRSRYAAAKIERAQQARRDIASAMSHRYHNTQKASKRSLHKRSGDEQDNFEKMIASQTSILYKQKLRQKEKELALQNEMKTIADMEKRELEKGEVQENKFKDLRKGMQRELTDRQTTLKVDEEVYEKLKYYQNSQRKLNVAKAQKSRIKFDRDYDRQMAEKQRTLKMTKERELQAKRDNATVQRQTSRIGKLYSARRGSTGQI